MTPLIRQYRHELGISEQDAASYLGMDIKNYREKEIGNDFFYNDELKELWNWFMPLVEKLPQDVRQYLSYIHTGERNLYPQDDIQRIS
jgi:transcriptional regulator with XRE-family HTH domain